MIIREAIYSASRLFAAQNIPDSDLEAEILAMHILGWDKAKLYADWDHYLSTENKTTWVSLVNRRLQGEPSAYIVGLKEFYALDFKVGPGVFIPRPETEQLVERALQLLGEFSYQDHVLVADPGTGSGAVSIALAVNNPSIHVVATDMSMAALQYASLNVQQNGVNNRVHLIRGNFLDPIRIPVHMVTANLPYVPKEMIETLQTEIRSFEPREALDGGVQGLELYQQLLEQVPGRVIPRGYVLMEVDHSQSHMLATMAMQVLPGCDAIIHKDSWGIEMLVEVRLP